MDVEVGMEDVGDHMDVAASMVHVDDSISTKPTPLKKRSSAHAFDISSQESSQEMLFLEEIEVDKPLPSLNPPGPSPSLISDLLPFPSGTPSTVGQETPSENTEQFPSRAGRDPCLLSPQHAGFIGSDVAEAITEIWLQEATGMDLFGDLGT
ncbi:hypothetical protein BC829DRAFT_381960 [Chytridium lagenaria]|nr:hypothetical protein BC829DRAFT_381960 [Chytridium lagenaria]